MELNQSFPQNNVFAQSEYCDVQPIGKGTFSSVYLATHKLTQTPVAIKSVKKSMLSDPVLNRNFQRELRIMRKIDFPFVIHYYSILEDESYIYVVMEFSRYGSLLQYLNKCGPFSEEDAQAIFCQFLSVLRYLHTESNVLHRDLKMENVLLTSGSSIRLIDFGLSSEFTKDNDNLLETRCGSFPYAAPEIFRKKPYTATVDMWSAGIILYTMVVGRLPFHDANNKKLIHMICHEEPVYPDHLSPELKDFLQNLLMKDRHKRFTVRQASEHPWIARSEHSFYASDYFLAQRQFRVLPRNTQEIDREILGRIVSMDYPINTFDCDILSGVETQTTALYRMMRQEKVMELIRQQNSVKKDQMISRRESEPPTKLPSLIQGVNPRLVDSQKMASDSSTLQFKRSDMTTKSPGQLEMIIRRARQPQSNRARQPVMSIIRK